MANVLTPFLVSIASGCVVLLGELNHLMISLPGLGHSSPLQSGAYRGRLCGAPSTLCSCSCILAMTMIYWDLANHLFLAPSPQAEEEGQWGLVQVLMCCVASVKHMHRDLLHKCACTLPWYLRRGF